MNRRSLLKYSTMLGVTSSLSSLVLAEAEPAKGSGGGIVLYCDLAIDPAREQEMLHHFHMDFLPAAAKFDGYIDVKMLKLRKVMQGQPAPMPNINYRFQLTYKSEELRQKWIASAIHQRVWPLIEDTVTNKDYLVLLTDKA
ncbi:hypothetical protein Terro_1767 [Terriglobus roseus DSM 18391]|uniref:Uncharacterized protein n=1 Tax=Terriglobus roseus (strain DSM 18391 / NRRL B-41598 / KBS 63) TaxID=926566 RepID=I3ZFP5_TERRK|nr:hypothetical protein [Terriglobus roseus]AFL88063.1 hypothetical protein Terro_1767 [Terriglobus roseus DSM 18391]